MSPVLAILGNDDTHPPARRQGGVWQLTEHHTWRVQLAERYSATVEGRELPWDPSIPGVVLPLPFAMGRLTLHLQRDGHPSLTVPLEVKPDAAKLGLGMWTTLLDELENWLAGLTTGAEAPTAGGVHTTGVKAPLLANALLPIVPALHRALAAVYQQPRHRIRDLREDRPLHQTRAADRETLAWLVRHPREAAWLDPTGKLDLPGPPPVLPQRHTVETLDHAANRHIVWLVDRVVRVLRATAGALRGVPDNTLNDTQQWCQARASALDRAAEGLSRQHRRSPFAQLRPQPANDAALLVVLDHPRYTRAHRLARRFLTAKFRPETAELAPPSRPTWDLYELWCFLAVYRGLKGVLGPTWAWTHKGMDRLRALDGRGTGAVFTATRGAEILRVHFNPRFSGYLHRGKSPIRFSISGEMYPDITVALNGGPWLAFDAKYSVSKRSLVQQFTSAHRYHDALRWPTHGGRAQAVLLLCPRALEDTRPWFFDAFHAEHGVGAFALAPGTAKAADLARWVCATLDVSTQEAA